MDKAEAPPEGVMLENELLRLFLKAFDRESALLARVIDESLEEVSTESEPRFANLRRLRVMYHTFTEGADEAALYSIQEELSESLAGERPQGNN